MLAKIHTVLRRAGPALIAWAVAVIAAQPGFAAAQDRVVASVPGFISEATLLGRAPVDEKLHLVVFLRYPRPAAVADFARVVNDPASPMYGAYMSPHRFTDEFEPSPQAYAAVEYALLGAGLQIAQAYDNRKVVDVVATVAQAEAFFHTVINRYRYDGHIYDANALPATVPSSLGGLVMAVSGLNNFARHVAQPPVVRNPAGIPFGYGPLDVQTAYDAPMLINPSLDGRGVTIALETAYDFADGDVGTYWRFFGIRRTGYVIRKVVDDPVPVSGSAPATDVETTLDVELVTSNAPAANVVVYEAVDPLNATFDDLYEQTVSDPRVDVVATSWGLCEPNLDPYEAAADNDLFEQAAAEGQTWFAASGNSGAEDCRQAGATGYDAQHLAVPAVDFPASSPWVAAGGGTTLQPTLTGRARGAETAWPGSGGGVSRLFGLPPYQQEIATLADRAGRNVPDVALNADPATPYALYDRGSWGLSAGGTDCVAPILAALWAQFDQYQGRRLGLAQADLYRGLALRTYPGQAWHDIVSGTNGGYAARTGYDNVTGVGSLDAYRFLLQLPPMPNATRL